MVLVLPFLYIPDRIKVSPTETTDVEMTCQVLFGNDPAGMKWRWLRDGLPVNTTDRVQISFVNSSTWQTRLSIREIRLQEGGLYECVVANAFGSYNQSIQVNVHGKCGQFKPRKIFAELSFILLLFRYAFASVAFSRRDRRDYRVYICFKVLSNTCKEICSKN